MNNIKKWEEKLRWITNPEQREGGPKSGKQNLRERAWNLISPLSPSTKFNSSPTHI